MRVLERAPPTELVQLRGRLGATPLSARSNPLRLLPPYQEGQEKRTSKRRDYKANFAPAQRARIRALLRNLRTAYGSWSCLAEVTGYGARTLCNVATNPSRATYALVAQIAKAAGMTVDEVLSPRLAPVAGCCPLCGRKGAR